MKHLAFLLIFLFVFLLLLGCEDKITEVISPEELSPPLGLKSVTGDQKVTLIWYTSNFESDLDGYLIYKYEGPYYDLNPKEYIPTGFSVAETLKTPGGESFTVQTDTVYGFTNGVTYSFLVVAARDDWTEISHTSNIVKDTPRPEKLEYDTLYAREVNIDKCGYELFNFTRVSMIGIDQNYDTQNDTGDIICEKFDPGAGDRIWLAGANGAVMMDLGYMSDWDNADTAMGTGYVDPGYSLTAVEGHVYSIRTRDSHYAKIRVEKVNITEGYVSFKACYQNQTGSRQYKIRP